MVSMIQYLVIFTQTYSFQDSDGKEKFLTLPVLKSHILTNRLLFNPYATNVIYIWSTHS